MNLRIFNSMSRAVEPFVPQQGNSVLMYVCGPTVYDAPHLGNLRVPVVFDILVRHLNHQKIRVSYAQNYTDIDDKIMARAAQTGKSIDQITREAIDQYEMACDWLRVARPTVRPRVSTHIPHIIQVIEKLIANGHAYVAEGHVLFDVATYPQHGALSRHEQTDLRPSGRVEHGSYKKNDADFVLWKPSSDDQPGWESPWSRGRPGWHIECSAMIEAVFAGRTLDIHGGGADLRFPHHDCEISQTVCAHNHPVAKTWMHVGMLLVNGKKMAKSEGNFIKVSDLDDKYSGEEVRLALLQSHYRQPLNWTDAGLMQARDSLNRWRDALLPYRDECIHAILQGKEPGFEALDDDLNTPMLIAQAHEWAKSLLSRSATQHDIGRFAVALNALGVLQYHIHDDLPEPAHTLFNKYVEMRAQKDYAMSDIVREAISQFGFSIKDEKGGSYWWRKGF